MLYLIFFKKSKNEKKNFKLKTVKFYIFYRR